MYINQNTIHIPHQTENEQRVQIFIKKGTEIIHEGMIPLTHKLNKGRYKIQFRNQIIFNQEWYTYKVWSQELSVQKEHVDHPKQSILKHKNRITFKIPEVEYKRQYGIVANANYVNNQDVITKQTQTTSHMASTFIILSIIFLFVFLLVISSYIIYHTRRRNMHDRHFAFPLVSLF